MRKLIVQEYMSLDGFVADSTGALTFTAPYARGPEIDADAAALIDSLDLIILGEVTYKLFAKIWPGRTNSDTIIADSLNGTPKMVFSQELQKAPWGSWEAAEIVSDRAEQKIARLKQQSGKTMVVWGSISLAQSLIGAGLVDEYQFLVCPTVIGDGRRLFPTDAPLKMKPLETKIYSSGLVLMRYEPAPSSFGNSM